MKERGRERERCFEDLAFSIITSLSFVRRNVREEETCRQYRQYRRHEKLATYNTMHTGRAGPSISLLIPALEVAILSIDCGAPVH